MKRLKNTKNLLYSTFDKDINLVVNGKKINARRKLFYTVLRKEKGKPVIEDYAMQKIHKVVYCKLMQRQTYNGIWINENLTKQFMSPGWTLTDLENCTEKLVKVDSIKPIGNYYNSSELLYNNDDLRNCFKQFKYLTYYRNEYIVNDPEYIVYNIEYLKNWEKYPTLEYYAKSGYLWMAFRPKLLEIEDREFFKWFKAQPDLLHYKSNQILTAYKKGLSIIQYKNLKTLKGLDKEWILSQKEYIMKSDYEDYVEMGKILHINIDPMPKDFWKAHNRLAGKIEEHEKAEESIKLKEISTHYKNVEKDGLEFKVFTGHGDFQKVGRELENCVARMNYDERMANKECLVGAIWKEDKPIECVEFIIEDNKFILNQCRGKGNRDSIYHNLCEEICKLFIKKNKVYI